MSLLLYLAYNELIYTTYYILFEEKIRKSYLH